MLAGLGHRAVGRRDHQDGTVHLGRAGDHVLDVVGVARAVDVGVVPLLALVLDVRDGDRHRLGRVADRAALGDVGVRLGLGPALLGQDRQDGGRQRRLAVVDVPDRAHVDVRLGSGESFLGHVLTPFASLVLLMLAQRLSASLRAIAGNCAQPPHTLTLRCSAGLWLETRLPAARGGNRRPTFTPEPSGSRPQEPESCRWDLNPGPRPYQGRALPTEPRQQVDRSVILVPFDPVRRRRSARPRRPPRRLDTPATSSTLRRLPPRPGSPLRGRAGDGNRTHVACLEGRYSTIELHPRLVCVRHPGSIAGRLRYSSSPATEPWSVPAADSLFAIVPPCAPAIKFQSVPYPSGRDMGGAGFEPAKALPPDLQSGPFGRLGIHPRISICSVSIRSQSHPSISVSQARHYPSRSGPARIRQSWRRDSNSQPSVYKTDALPVELRQQSDLSRDVPRPVMSPRNPIGP